MIEMYDQNQDRNSKHVGHINYLRCIRPRLLNCRFVKFIVMDYQ
jgi:hypothetical protein